MSEGGERKKRNRKSKEPVRAYGSFTPFTPEKKARFIELLRKCHNVARCARAVGVSRQTPYDARESDPVFAAEWDAVKEEFSDKLETEGFRRAHDGTLKPVFQGGAKVGQVREYSDTLLIFLLKGNRPEKYRDRHELSGPNGGPIPLSIDTALNKVYGDGDPTE